MPLDSAFIVHPKTSFLVELGGNYKLIPKFCFSSSPKVLFLHIYHIIINSFKLMDNDSSSPLSPTDGSFNSLSQDETNLSREDKVALARKRLQQFQKKRKTSNSQLSATSAKESSRRTSETNAVNSRPTSAVSVTTRPLINDHVLQSPALPVTEPYEPSLHEEDIDGQPTIIYNPKLAGTLTPEEQQAIDEIIHSRPTTAVSIIVVYINL